MFKNRDLKNKFLYILLIGLISLPILFDIDSSSFYQKNEQTEKVLINGQYRRKDDDRIFKLDSKSDVKLDGYDTITIDGHFNKDIEKNKTVIMKLDNVNLNIWVNGDNIYSIQGGKGKNFSRSPGSGWVMFESKGIAKDDDIKIEFSNVYLNHKNTVFKEFYDNIYIGSNENIFADNIKNNLWNQLLNGAIICMGVIIFGFSSFLYKRINKQLVWFSIMTIITVIWLIINFDITYLLMYNSIFTNSLSIICMLFSICSFAMYFSIQLKSRWNKFLKNISIISVLIIIVSTITQLLRIADYYDYLLWIEIMCIALIIFIFLGVTDAYNRDRSEYNEKFMISTYILLLGATLDLILNVFNIIPSIIWFKISFYIFIILQFTLICSKIREYIYDGVKMNILKELDNKDMLTSMNNKSLYLKLVQSINKEIEIKANLRFTIIVFGICNLRNINKKYGYEKRNSIIKKYSNIIVEIFSNGNCFRTGIDEFTVIIKNQSNIKVNIQIIEFEENIKDVFSVDNADIVYGIATYDNKIDKSYEDAFVRADNAMCVKKQQIKL